MSDVAETGRVPSTEGLDEEARAIVEGLYGEGIVARKGAFPVAWVDQLNDDVLAAFEEARQREGGAVSRGPNRYYVEVHPEELRGFVRGQLRGSRTPDRVVFRRELPTNATGKVLRRELVTELNAKESA